MDERIREEYFKYLQSILIEHKEYIEPTVSEFEFQSSRDSYGRVVFYSPLRGESYRLWKYYSKVSPTAKFGHAIGKVTKNAYYEPDYFVIDIKTGERHHLDHDTNYIVGRNQVISRNSGFVYLVDFKGNYLGRVDGDDFPKDDKPEKKPRRPGIKCVVENGFFKTKYVYDSVPLDVKPILDYDGNFICYKDGFVYLYDKYHDDLTKLCDADDFDYTYNSIIIKDKRYMLFKGKMIDVTGFPDIDNYVLSNALINVLDYTEFKLLYETTPKYQEELAQAKADRARVQAEMEDQRRKAELIIEAEKREQRKAAVKQGLEETHEELLELYKKYLDLIVEWEKLGDDNPFVHKKVVPITPSILFVEVDGHKEINPFFQDNHLLRYANLSFIDFANVKLDHIDCLAYTNANIDPQTVFNKDLSYSDLRGIYHTMDNFDGVNMEGTIVDDNKLDFATNISDEAVINDSRTNSDMTGEEVRSSLTDSKKQ